MRKSIFILFFLLLICVKAFSLSAESAVLIDAHSGRVLMAQNAYRKMGMASTTKIMTAIVAIENGMLDDIVTISDAAAKTEGSSMYLKGGEKLSLRDLVYGLMLNSGNDAAVAIAEYMSGGVAAFADLMNQKAKELGLENTSFTNPHGLDDENHYTTAYDLAQLTRHALENPEFSKIVSTRSITIGSAEQARTLVNHNKMLSSYKNADGVKTGFTKKCGRCLVTSATRDCLQLIAVTLNAPDDWNDHKEMLDYGFSHYKWKSPVKKGDYMRTVNLIGADNDRLSLYSSEAVELAVNSQDTVRIVYDVPAFVKTPVAAGQAFGTAEVYVSDEIVKKVDLITQQAVEINKKDKFAQVFKMLLVQLLDMGG